MNFSFHVDGSQILFDYQWYAFPFQFCSTPMYIGLLAAVVKRKSLHIRLCSYLATYALFAGICVMAYPVTVFIDTVGINIQTMVCHGSMITTGIVLLRTGYVKVDGTVEAYLSSTPRLSREVIKRLAAYQLHGIDYAPSHGSHVTVLIA